MLTDRSAAGNALIHDQSRTINTGQSDSDSDYGVEVSNANLMRPRGEDDSDYGVEMTELKKNVGGEAVAEEKKEKKKRKRKRKSKVKSSPAADDEEDDDGNSAPATSADHRYEDDDSDDSDYGVEQMSVPQSTEKLTKKSKRKRAKKSKTETNLPSSQQDNDLIGEVIGDDSN